MKAQAHNNLRPYIEDEPLPEFLPEAMGIEDEQQRTRERRVLEGDTGEPDPKRRKT